MFMGSTHVTACWSYSFFFLYSNLLLLYNIFYISILFGLFPVAFDDYKWCCYEHYREGFLGSLSAHFSRVYGQE